MIAPCCPECGTVLISLTVGGEVCPRCLLTLALDASDSDPTERYRVVNVIGHSETGTVYLAEPVHSSRRYVAMHLLNTERDASEALDRLEWLVRTLADAPHPNVAQMIEAGLTGDRRLFLVSEFVSGVDLVQFCRRSRLDAVGRLSLFADVCHVVKHIHALGVVHGAIKASNLPTFIREDEPVIKLVDSGVVWACRQLPHMAEETTDIRALTALLNELLDEVSLRGLRRSATIDAIRARATAPDDEALTLGELVTAIDSWRRGATER